MPGRPGLPTRLTNTHRRFASKLIDTQFFGWVDACLIKCCVTFNDQPWIRHKSNDSRNALPCSLQLFKTTPNTLLTVLHSVKADKTRLQVARNCLISVHSPSITHINDLSQVLQCLCIAYSPNERLEPKRALVRPGERVAGAAEQLIGCKRLYEHTMHTFAARKLWLFKCIRVKTVIV